MDFIGFPDTVTGYFPAFAFSPNELRLLASVIVSGGQPDESVAELREAHEDLLNAMGAAFLVASVCADLKGKTL